MRQFATGYMAYIPEADELAVSYWTDNALKGAQYAVLHFTQAHAAELLQQVEPPGHDDDIARVMLAGLPGVQAGDLGWMAAMLHSVVRRVQLPGGRTQ